MSYLTNYYLNGFLLSAEVESNSTYHSMRYLNGSPLDQKGSDIRGHQLLTEWSAEMNKIMEPLGVPPSTNTVEEFMKTDAGKIYGKRVYSALVNKHTNRHGPSSYTEINS